MPEKPPHMSIAEVVMANAMARRIQDFWIMYRIESKRQKENREAAIYFDK